MVQILTLSLVVFSVILWSLRQHIGRWVPWVVVGTIVGASAYHWFFLMPKLVAQFGQQYWMYDFHMCYEFGRGNSLSFPDVIPQWTGRIIYPSIVHYLWTPWSWFGSFEQTAPWYYGFQVLCYVLLSLKLCGRKYGWVVAIVGIRALYWSLDFGNVYPFLALLSLYALPIAISILVKPVFLLIVGTYAGRGLLDAYAQWKDHAASK